jgi:hypothetical protein
LHGLQRAKYAVFKYCLYLDIHSVCLHRE